MSKAKELFDAAELNQRAEDYIKAGNCYIVEDNYYLAANSFELAGKVYFDKGEKYLAAGTYVKVSDNYTRANGYKAAAVDLLEKSIDIYLENGKFASAAKQYEKKACLHVKDKNMTPAIEDYIKAHKYYCAEQSENTGYGCLYKAAQLTIENEEYTKAIKLLYQVNKYYEINELTQFKCKQLVLEIAILKLFSVDVNECKTYLSNLFNLDKHKSTREYILLQELIEAMEKSDKTQYNEAVGTFSAIQPLEGWKLKLLFEIEKRI